MCSEILKIINNIGATAAMINQIAAGQASFNAGAFPIDNAEATAVLSRLLLLHVDELLEQVHITNS